MFVMGVGVVGEDPGLQLTNKLSSFWHYVFAVSLGSFENQKKAVEPLTTGNNEYIQKYVITDS